MPPCGYEETGTTGRSDLELIIPASRLHGSSSMKMPRPQEDLFDDSAAKLAEIQQIFEQYLFPIYAGMVSSEIFSRESKPGAIRAYLRLKQLLGIERGCGPNQVDAVEKYKQGHPNDYARIISELEYQVAVLSLRKNSRHVLYDNLFHATAILFNASPMSQGDTNPENMKQFKELIRSGRLRFE